MDYCSFFIENKAFFGGFPTKESIEIYENRGVRYFIDLTNGYETGITPYKTKYSYLNYPIVDRRYPTCWFSFSQFIIKLVKILTNLKSGELMYLHCKGGHGRSGIVVACLFCYLYHMEPTDALDLTKKCHSKRKIMKMKWRNVGSPQTKFQKMFVCKFFDELKVYKENLNPYIKGFSPLYQISLEVPGVGTFYTLEAAYQAHKNLQNEIYVNVLKELKSGEEARKLGESVETHEEWEGVKYEVMYKLVKLKLEQYPSLRKNLENTGFRKILDYSFDDPYWSSLGMNMFGKILEEIRYEYYTTIHLCDLHVMHPEDGSDLTAMDESYGSL